MRSPWYTFQPPQWYIFRPPLTQLVYGGPEAGVIFNCHDGTHFPLNRFSAKRVHPELVSAAAVTVIGDCSAE